MELQVELDDVEIRAALGRAIALLRQPAPLFDAIGAQLKTNIELRFDAKRDPEGQPWAPLAPATREIYESEWFIRQNPAFKGGIPGSLLERTRQLRLSLAYNASDELLEVGTSRLSKGGAWQIGWLHETGTRRMPRRGLLVADPKTGALGADDRADVLEILGEAIDGAFGS